MEGTRTVLEKVVRGSFRLCYTDVAFRQDLTMSAALGRLLEFVRLQSAGSPQRAP